MTNETENNAVDLGRRRLAKCGLAAPVVLATLASKNALADPSYRCTISGQLSGNYSPVPTDGTNRQSTASCDLGSDVAELKANIGWGSVVKTTSFKDVFSLLNSNVYFVSAGKLVNNTVSGATPATLDQVLKLSVNSMTPPPDIVLGRAAITAYVASVNASPNYPLLSVQVKEMFDFAIRGLNYEYPGGMGTVYLNRTEIVQYFRFLIGGVPPTINPSA